MIWTLNEMMAATGGKCTRQDVPPAIFGIDFDSRKISDGDLFLALKGGQADGHDYLTKAKDQGAVAALVDHPCPDDIPQIVVDDVMTGLRDLAKASRKRSHAKITAITGSVGKTGTRDLIATCLKSMGQTHATEGNYNNHIGAPLSLARMPEQTEFGVFELGMDHAGEIAALSPLVAPHIAIITKIAASHIGFFDSLEGIAHAKAEIFDGLIEGGFAILNADDDFAPMLAKIAKEKGAGRVITVGVKGDADARIERIEALNHGYEVTARIDGIEVNFTLGMSASHWVLSAVMGLVAVHHFGGDMEKAAGLLADHRELEGRGARFALSHQGQNFTLIDDSYNASPASMVAGINNLGATTQPANGRKIAILADMLELGDEAEDYHRELITPLKNNGIDILICFGPMMASLAEIAKDNMDVHFCDDATRATDIAMSLIQDGDVVLVKGSNGMKAYQIVKSMKAKGQGGTDAA